MVWSQDLLTGGILPVLVAHISMLLLEQTVSQVQVQVQLGQFLLVRIGGPSGHLTGRFHRLILSLGEMILCLMLCSSADYLRCALM